MSREAHVRICERLGSDDPGRLDYLFVIVVKVRLRKVCSWLPVVRPRNTTSVKVEKVRSGKTVIK